MTEGECSAELQCLGSNPHVPRYLAQTYWWAYLHPRSVHVFERQWLINLILWGNFHRLRDAALDALGGELRGRTLQVACVYGDLTSRLAARLAPDGRLHVVDILRIQLDNLARKLRLEPLRAEEGGGSEPRVALMQANSAALDLETASYDRALMFFLLHEQPEAVRRETLAEALRVVRPGGRIVIVDYHRPHRLHPLYWPMVGILRLLEPYAMDLWRDEIPSWFPAGVGVSDVSKRTVCGGLYQLLSITV